jgi:hypothetical protein
LSGKNGDFAVADAALFVSCDIGIYPFCVEF